ncbi:uncharacterized protein LOC134744155 [Cydia strobilella]|uniref:uncharacterized protein LOC134744155 n=1 Tax=Cydia strobilella TaxID=1100964 RepID=UPI003007BC12
MASDIISSLHLDKNTTSRVIVAKEINGCDSSFITSCILGNCIKSKQAVLFIATHNSLLHYQNVGLKMNYNLQKHVDAGLVHFLKLDEELVNLLMANEEKSLENIFTSINQIVQTLKLNNNVVHIILDGVSHLFDMQYTLRNVNKFCNQLIQLNRGNIASFVLFHCNVAHEEDVTHVMANLLCHTAHTILEVRNLLSGLSADVSGHLTIKYPGHKFEDEHINTIDMKPSRYLFKLFDRGVKLFAPGTV